jgi:site-specific DNA recombinase
VVEEDAAFVRDLFRRYLEIGNVVRLKAVLDQENLRLPIRTNGIGKATGGGPIGRGHLYKILSNPIYLGRLTHKGQVHEGLHDPIIDQETWNRVEALLAEHAQRTERLRQHSHALLAGKLFDDRGNRMSPSHAAKKGQRWRYYVSQAILQGRKHEAGSVGRVAAIEIERRVAEAVHGALSIYDCQHLNGSSNASADLAAMRRGALENAANSRTAVERVVISRTSIESELAEGMVSEDQNRIKIIPWRPPSPYRRREIILGEDDQSPALRPMRTQARALLVDALRDAQRWLDELTANPDQTIEALAMREGRTERWIRRTLSLTFLCPSLIQAGVEGRLPRGFGVKRLMDLPLIWADQWKALGLKAPIKT